jgi:hypothetical protein
LEVEEDQTQTEVAAPLPLVLKPFLLTVAALLALPHLGLAVAVGGLAALAAAGLRKPSKATVAGLELARAIARKVLVVVLVVQRQVRLLVSV